MNNNRRYISTSNKIGFWAAITVAALFVLYTVSFIVILTDGPMFIWTDMPAYLAFNGAHDQTMKYVSYGAMMLLGVAYVVMAECASSAAPVEGELFARLAVTFGALFALSSGINYFVQLVTVRINLIHGATDGLDQFIMGNPISAMAAINMLGWTFMLGLSAMSLSLALRGVRRAAPARFSLMAMAAVCITGGLGFVMNSTLIVGICMYPLLGGSVIAAAVTMALFFGKSDGLTVSM